MKFQEQKIKGVFEIQLDPVKDHRGFFMRAYDAQIFKKQGLDRKWIQESHSYNAKIGTVRGFHFQLPPNMETKLVRVVNGAVLDIFLDLRKNSHTFGQWAKIILSAQKNNMLYLPPGIGHGMCTLTDNTVMLYKIDAYYMPEHEDNILWNSPSLKIDWPVKNPTISERDAKAPTFQEFMEKYGGLNIK